MDDEVLNTPKKKRSIIPSMFKFTFCLVVIGVAIYYIVPSAVTKKEEYVSIAKEIMESVENFVERDDIKARDTNTTYYIPVSCINFYDNVETPYGKLSDAYVIVTYSGTGHRYYLISKDTSNFGIATMASYKELSADDIKPDVMELNTNIGITNKENIVVYNKDCSASEKKLAYSFYDPETGNITENNLIAFSNQQVQGIISVGDEIVIGNKEHFYVISTNDKTTTLLAKYNLYVGYVTEYDDEQGYKLVKKILKSDKDYGIQSEKTIREGVGVVAFSSESYWAQLDDIYNSSIYDKEKIAEDIVKNEQEDDFITVSSNNYSVAYYLEPYFEILKLYGLDLIEGRLMTGAEAAGLGCSKTENCPWYNYEWLKNTSFWLGSVEWNTNYKNHINTIDKKGNYSSENYKKITTYGLRPVIVIATDDILE